MLRRVKRDDLVSVHLYGQLCELLESPIKAVSSKNTGERPLPLILKAIQQLISRSDCFYRKENCRLKKKKKYRGSS